MKQEDEQQYVGTGYVARLFGVGTPTVGRWIEEGALKAIKVSVSKTGKYNRWLIPISEVERLKSGA